MSASSEDIKALVLTAVKKAGKRAFFDTNEYISKRLVESQYGQYAKLASVSISEIRLHIDDRIKNSAISNHLGTLAKSGVLKREKMGRHYVYWLPDTAYLAK